MSTANRRLSIGRLVEEGTFLLMVSIGSLIFILALLILFHENATATKGYQLRTLDRERSYLLLEEEVLKMDIAKAQSLETLQNDKRVKTMIEIVNPVYSESR
jgi:hypothetical protein